MLKASILLLPLQATWKAFCSCLVPCSSPGSLPVAQTSLRGERILPASHQLLPLMHPTTNYFRN